MKTAVITGTAQGIGRALADGFAEAGYRVLGADRREHNGWVGDLTEAEEVARFAEYVRSQTDSVDVLIHNAMEAGGGLQTADRAAMERSLAVGVVAPFDLTQRLLPLFATGACVLTILSTRMHQSQTDTECYTAAKGGLYALTHAMAMSLAGSVRVNGIAPGWIETGEANHTDADRRQHPAGRVGTPQDIVRAALFLADPHNSFIDGAVLTVDGGMQRRMIYHDDEGWAFRA